MLSAVDHERDDAQPPLLAVENVAASYGSLKVVLDVSLEVRVGVVTALLGSNGVGKTTLMRCIAGLLPVSQGTMTFAGRSVTHVPSHQRVADGIVLVPEGRQIFPDFTVEENLRLGAFSPIARKNAPRRIAEIFDLFPRLRERRRQNARTLSGGEQQMLALGRGLMSGPKLLLLDEPSLGLSPIMTQHLFASIESIRADGVTVFIVEQNVGITLSIADYAYVLARGRVEIEGTGESLAQDTRIKAAYLGL